jgi:hypothetical protein
LGATSSSDVRNDYGGYRKSIHPFGGSGILPNLSKIPARKTHLRFTYKGSAQGQYNTHRGMREPLRPSGGGGGGQQRQSPAASIDFGPHFLLAACWLWVPKSSCWLKPHPPRCTVSRSDGGHPLEVVPGARISDRRWAQMGQAACSWWVSPSPVGLRKRGGVRSRHVRRRCLELMGALYSY